MAREKAAGPKNRAPERIQNVERALYVKALRLANDQPDEVREIQALHLKLIQWMTNTEKVESKPMAADLPVNREPFRGSDFS